MKSRNIKTRLAAFGLALLMGLSPLGNLADVHAAETKNPSEPVTESVEISETEQTEEASEAAKHLVTAEDITKDISDKDFMAETCMEGIHYNSEQEDVTLERIEAEDGGSYHPDQAGTYIATYWVVPKDARDSYSVSRKIILTDTEGQAHTEENGGQKQKEDTNSEEDSETPVQEIPDVEVTISGEDADAQAARELEEKIEDGEVMMLSGAENTFRAKETVHLEKGETIYYPSYIGNYLTCWFTVNGKIAYCLESHRSSPPSGDYVAQVLDSNKNLQKVLYYGYGGAGDITGSYLSGKSAEEKYVYTHIAASYAYAGEAGFTGCKYEDLVNAGVIAYIDHLFAMEEPPKGEISLSKTSVKAVRNGNVQKTPDITLSGDHRNYISVNVPKDITIYNKTKGTSAENGALKIYGGDTFYLTAPMLHTGNYSSGELHGSVGETWRTLVLSTGNSNQDIGVFESEKANPVSFTVDWLEMTRIELFKQDADTKNPLDGAVYGIYTDSKCEHLLMEMPVTGEEGKAVSDYFEAAIKTVYVKEIKAPDKYAQSDVIHKVDVEAGKGKSGCKNNFRCPFPLSLSNLLCQRCQRQKIIIVVGGLVLYQCLSPSPTHIIFSLVLENILHGIGFVFIPDDPCGETHLLCFDGIISMVDSNDHHLPLPSFLFYVKFPLKEPLPPKARPGRHSFLSSLLFFLLLVSKKCLDRKIMQCSFQNKSLSLKAKDSLAL